MDTRKLKTPDLKDIDWVRDNPTSAARIIHTLRQDIESMLTALERALASGDPGDPGEVADIVVSNQRQRYER